MKSRFEEQLKDAMLNPVGQHSAMPEPFPGHEERFEMRLLKMSEDKKVRQLPRWPWMVLAAACIAGVILFITVKEVKQTNEMARITKLSDVSRDMAEVENFYHQRLNIDYSKMNTSDIRIQRFLSDIKKLEEEYASLEKQLAQNYNNERLIKAMITNYQYRLRIMEHMQKYIEIQNEHNNSNNEQPIS
ncbi:MAG: hypothetical protein ACKVOR_10380 [Flavobacteriales bacterium]